MLKTICWKTLLTAGVVAVTLGCGQEEPATIEGAANGDISSQSTPAEATGNRLPGASDAEAPGDGYQSDDPQIQISYALREVKEGRPQRLWNHLPVSYQADVTELIHEFADQTDPELWQGTVATLQGVLNVVKSKKPFIVGLPALQQQPPQVIAAYVDEFLQAWGLILSSELSDQERVKHMDVGKFLSESGAVLLTTLNSMYPSARNPLSQMAITEATVLNRTGETAQVRLQVGADVPQTVEFVQVEGRWIPTSLRDQWDSRIAAIREEMDTSPEEQLQSKQQGMMILGMLNGIVKEFEAATTQDEFNQVTGQAMGKAMGMMMMINGPAEAQTQPGNPESLGSPERPESPASQSVPE